MLNVKIITRKEMIGIYESEVDAEIVKFMLQGDYITLRNTTVKKEFIHVTDKGDILIYGEEVRVDEDGLILK